MMTKSLVMMANSLAETALSQGNYKTYRDYKSLGIEVEELAFRENMALMVSEEIAQDLANLEQESLANGRKNVVKGKTVEAGLAMVGTLRMRGPVSLVATKNTASRSPLLSESNSKLDRLRT